jgi:hypothetical protein
VASLPPAGYDGLPSVSQRAFYYIDIGWSVWAAVYYAVVDYVQALAAYAGGVISGYIGQIGV